MLHHFIRAYIITIYIVPNLPKLHFFFRHDLTDYISLTYYFDIYQLGWDKSRKTNHIMYKYSLGVRYQQAYRIQISRFKLLPKV